jgi:hypothetical protein
MIQLFLAVNGYDLMVGVPPPGETDCGGTSCNPNSAGYGGTPRRIWIDTAGCCAGCSPCLSRKKYQIVHELGHGISDRGTDSGPDGVDDGYGKVNDANNAFWYDLVGDATPPVSDPDGNGNDCIDSGGTGEPPQTPLPGSLDVNSKEYVGGAIAEAFGHFYAADVFNSDAPNSNCWLKHYKWVNGVPPPTINCDNGLVDWLLPEDDAPVAQGYMEFECSGSGNPGRGVMIDWVRTFWNIHTAGSTPSSFTTILDDLLDDVSDEPWGNECGYDYIDAHAQTLNNQLETNWDRERVAHGIDWPMGFYACPPL